MHRTHWLSVAVVALMLTHLSVYGEGETGSVLVILPERIDVDWFWYHYTRESQHLVQSAVEKALLRGEFEVLDIAAYEPPEGESHSLENFVKPQSALAVARSMGATWLVLGMGEANLASHNQAYGINVMRATADVSARVLDVESGKVVAVKEVSETAGSESQKTSSRQALKAAGRKLGRQLVKALEALE